MFELDGRLESVPAVGGYDKTAFDLESPNFHVRKAPRADNYRGFWFASLVDEGPGLEAHLGGAKLAFDQLIDRAPDGSRAMAHSSATAARVRRIAPGVSHPDAKTPCPSTRTGATRAATSLRSRAR